MHRFMIARPNCTVRDLCRFRSPLEQNYRHIPKVQTSSVCGSRGACFHRESIVPRTGREQPNGFRTMGNEQVRIASALSHGACGKPADDVVETPRPPQRSYFRNRYEYALGNASRAVRTCSPVFLLNQERKSKPLGKKGLVCWRRLAAKP